MEKGDKIVRGLVGESDRIWRENVPATDPNWKSSGGPEVCRQWRMMIKKLEFPTESVFFGQYRSVFFGIYKYYTGDKIGQYIVLYVTTIKYVIW